MLFTRMTFHGIHYHIAVFTSTLVHICPRKINNQITCLTSLLCFTKAWIENSCLNGSLTTLKVASIYHTFGRLRRENISGVLNTRWCWRPTFTSACRKLAGIWRWSILNSRSVGSLGRDFRLFLFACLARLETLEMAEHGASVTWATNTSSAIAPADLKWSCIALVFTSLMI